MEINWNAPNPFTIFNDRLSELIPVYNQLIGYFQEQGWIKFKRFQSSFPFPLDPKEFGDGHRNRIIQFVIPLVTKAVFSVEKPIDKKSLLKVISSNGNSGFSPSTLNICAALIGLNDWDEIEEVDSWSVQMLIHEVVTAINDCDDNVFDVQNANPEKVSEIIKARLKAKEWNDNRKIRDFITRKDETETPSAKINDPSPAVGDTKEREVTVPTIVFGGQSPSETEVRFSSATLIGIGVTLFVVLVGGMLFFWGFDRLTDQIYLGNLSLMSRLNGEKVNPKESPADTVKKSVVETYQKPVAEKKNNPSIEKSPQVFFQDDIAIDRDLRNFIEENQSIMQIGDLTIKFEHSNSILPVLYGDSDRFGLRRGHLVISINGIKFPQGDIVIPGVTNGTKDGVETKRNELIEKSMRENLTQLKKSIKLCLEKSVQLVSS